MKLILQVFLTRNLHVKGWRGDEKKLFPKRCCMRNWDNNFKPHSVTQNEVT